MKSLNCLLSLRALKMRSILISALLCGLVFLISVNTFSQNSVWAWGSDWEQEIGNPSASFSNPLPLWVYDLSNASKLSTGYYHSLVLKADGSVWQWGHCLEGGQLPCYQIPEKVQNLTNIAAVSAGGFHSLALKDDGTVWAWGINEHGQLGDGTIEDKSTPIQVMNLINVIAIAGGAGHSMALENDGSLWAWGNNANGRLGNGTNEDKNTPVKVLNLEDVVAVDGGAAHSLALKNDGTVWAWGGNSSGQLGDGTNEDKNVPVKVLNLTNIIAISGGGWHSLALKNDGTVWAWGANSHGQLGDGTIFISNIPVHVMNLTDVKDISGGGRHSVALKNDGAVWTWGNNDYGVLGNGTSGTPSPVPVQVLNLSDVSNISAGFDFSVAISAREIIPPAIDAIKELHDPFRLKIKGNNFRNDAEIWVVGYPWDNFSYKSESLIILKKGKDLKNMFPKGLKQDILIVNPDSSCVIAYFTR